jgi:hypothetical protein
MRDDLLYRIATLELIHANIKDLDCNLETRLRSNFKYMVGFVPLLTRHTCFGSEFNRIVLNKYVTTGNTNTRLFSISQLKYPPPEVAKNLSYNRASLPAVSLFYAGYGRLTTTLETKPQKGDLYTTSIWKQKEGTSISYIPICYMGELIERTTEFDSDWDQFTGLLRKLDKNVSIVLERLYHFITKVFITPVDPKNKKEYIFSALFADLFLNDADNGVDCIYYPSVPMNYASSNIALKPSVLESKFELIEVTESICTSSPSNETSGWLSKRTGKGVNVSLSTKTIKWEDEYHEDVNAEEVYQQFRQKLKEMGKLPA